MRVEIRRTQAIQHGTELVGNRTRAKIVKNKVAPPFKEAIFDIMYGEGISKWGELVDLAVQLDLINKSGSWFSIGDERIGQGRACRAHRGGRSREYVEAAGQPRKAAHCTGKQSGERVGR